MELRISNPPNFHSPLSLVNIDEDRTAPCTEVASSLTNFRVDCDKQRMSYKLLQPNWTRHRSNVRQRYITPISQSLRSGFVASPATTAASLFRSQRRFASLSMLLLISIPAAESMWPVPRHTHLYRIEKLQDAGMPQSPELAHGVLRERQP